jgi:hypothetical protein
LWVVVVVVVVVVAVVVAVAAVASSDLPDFNLKPSQRNKNNIFFYCFLNIFQNYIYFRICSLLGCAICLCFFAISYLFMFLCY